MGQAVPIFTKSLLIIKMIQRITGRLPLYDENKLLNDILYNLRLKYIQHSKAD